MNDAVVSRLADESAVLRQLGRSARLLDQKNWAGLPEVFAQDIHFDYGDGRGEQVGLEALRATFTRHLDRCGGTQHLLGSVVVVADGDDATTETYVQARHAGLGDLAVDTFDTNGEYVDRWARRQDSWVIVNRVVRWLTTSGNPAVLGL